MPGCGWVPLLKATVKLGDRFYARLGQLHVSEKLSRSITGWVNPEISCDPASVNASTVGDP